MNVEEMYQQIILDHYRESITAVCVRTMTLR